ncbi:MAG: aminoglycoside phosphotransferase family protein [Anaerolineales bacterium]|nr:aminoglycoside phosphotransferase family protein [Anaerolineales bacterium]
MTNTSSTASTTLLIPPDDHLCTQTGDWFSLPNPDPITDYLAANLWDRDEKPESWQAARLSPAAYVYRETITGWTIAAKFHIVKTGADAARHAAHEYQYIHQAWKIGALNDMRAIRPLGLWRGVLFLEYVDGLTLEDKIAIRRSQPGELIRILESTGRYLADLHSRTLQPEIAPDFGQVGDKVYKTVDNLSKHGVLQNDTIAQSGFTNAIERWAADPLMWDFEPVQAHGDATTTNFIFTLEGGLVVVDWERSGAADPAADLGRLVAEVTHSIDRYGGTIVEAGLMTEHLKQVYTRVLPPVWNIEALRRRSQFYQAASTLRIARNGWLSRMERTALVLQALALLS